MNVVWRVPLDGQIVANSEGVWVLNGTYDTMERLDPTSGRVLRHIVLPYADSAAYADGYLWVTGPAD